MADYYTDFSFAVPISEQDRKWIEDHFAIWADEYEEEEPGTIAMEFSENQNGPYMWIHSDYGEGNVDQAIAWVRHFLKERQPDKKIGFEWANTCSKPRLDSFGGGAAIVSADGYEFINTGLWLSQQQGGDNG